MSEAWHHDRMHNERTVSNQVEQWKRLFPYWAERVGERRAVRIHSLGHNGVYVTQREQIFRTFTPAVRNPPLSLAIRKLVR